MPTRISAIDVGSNAIRMMIAEVHSGQIRPFKKYRASVRLGADVFRWGHVTEETLKQAEEAFLHFSHLNQKFHVDRCRAVATSATREAKNKQDFVRRVEQKAKIGVEVISGTEEAKLIFSAVKHEVPLKSKNVVLIDIGGGSVEVTHVENERIKASESFPIGTVRLLDTLRKKKMNESHLKIILGDYLSSMNQFVEKHFSGINFDFAIGTGGNLECLARLKLDLLKKTPNTYCTLDELVDITQQLQSMSIRDRIEKLKLRPDRADVILPATLVVKTIMRQSGSRKILIPCVGLRDGILWSIA